MQEGPVLENSPEEDVRMIYGALPWLLLCCFSLRFNLGMGWAVPFEKGS